MSDERIKPLGNLSTVMPQHGTVSVSPAKRWEDALVAGNGIMGALLYGDPRHDTLIANHCKLWLPRGSREVVPSVGDRLPELRKVIGESGYTAGQEFFCRNAEENGWDGSLIWTDAYHPGFFLKIEQQLTGDVRDYARVEDFSSGEVWAEWRSDEGRFSRRMFVSKTDNVIALITTGPNGRITQTIRMLEADNSLVRSEIESVSDGFLLHNTYVKGKGGYDAALRVIVEGGETNVVGGSVSVVGANSVTLIGRILPWKTPLPESQAWPTSPDNPDFSSTYEIDNSSTVQIAGPVYDNRWQESLKACMWSLPKSYAALLMPHASAWFRIFDRVSLDLHSESDERAMSSEALRDLARKEHRLPAALLERMYDAGRYIYMCSAGPQTPPNLYGIWTGTWSPEWSGDYTTDTNLQLEIESAYSGNMAELMEGYFNLWDRYLPDFQRNARELYGCRGILVGSRSSNNGLALHWDRSWPGNMWTPGAAWMAHWHFDHYLYTGDKDFLRERAIPFMEQAALFWEDFLAGTEDESGRYVFRPSYSAENSWDDNASQDIEIVTELLSNLIDGCEYLGIKEDEVARWKNMLEKMPNLLVNDEGQLQEFAIPNRPDNNDHRHMMHLYWAFDAPRFSLDHDPALYAGAQKALLNRIRYSTTQSSGTHGRMHIALSAVQLGLPNLAYTRLTMMAGDRSMYSNLVTSHEPGPDIFCVDGNGAIPEIVNRMIVQSQLGRLFLLPAVPDALPKGALYGVRARGQIEIVKILWDMRRGTVTATLKSFIDQTIDLVFPLDTIIDRLTAEGTARVVISQGVRRTGCRLYLPVGKPITVEAKFHFD